jgi:hypothetical protein
MQTHAIFTGLALGTAGLSILPACADKARPAARTSEVTENDAGEPRTPPPAEPPHAAPPAPPAVVSQSPPVVARPASPPSTASPPRSNIDPLDPPRPPRTGAASLRPVEPPPEFPETVPPTTPDDTFPAGVTVLEEERPGVTTSVKVQVDDGRRVIMQTRNVKRMRVHRQGIGVTTARSAVLRIDDQGIEWTRDAEVVELERSRNGEWLVVPERR